MNLRLSVCAYKNISTLIRTVLLFLGKKKRGSKASPPPPTGFMASISRQPTTSDLHTLHTLAVRYPLPKRMVEAEERERESEIKAPSSSRRIRIRTTHATRKPPIPLRPSLFFSFSLGSWAVRILSSLLLRFRSLGPGCIPGVPLGGW